MKVSVAMITFNHENFIREAIEGVLMQRTDFKYNLIIGEDYSNDATRIICNEYESNNPEKVVLLPSNENLGMARNLTRTLQACNGKYIAICEGDDYWIDLNKLQKQVDFLESHPDVSLCFTNSSVLYNESNKIRDWSIQLSSRYYEANEIMFDLVVPTASVVFKNVINENLINRLLNPNYIMGDIILWLSLAEYGRLYCLNEQMVVYRKSMGSLAYKLSLDKQVQSAYQHEEISLDFNGKYKDFEKKILSRQYLILSLKYALKFNKKALYFFNKSIVKYPLRFPANIAYTFKRLFSRDRSL